MQGQQNPACPAEARSRQKFKEEGKPPVSLPLCSSPDAANTRYPMKSSTRSATLCIACSARCAACFALLRIDGLSIAPAATIDTTAPAIAPVAMPEIKGETRIKDLPPFIKFDRISMPARPSNFTKQKNVCLAQSTIYNSPVILYNYHNNPPLRCGP